MFALFLCILKSCTYKLETLDWDGLGFYNISFLSDLVTTSRFNGNLRAKDKLCH